MVRWSDRPVMTIAVDLGSKATKQTNKHDCGPGVINLFSCSTPLIMNSQLLIKTEIIKNKVFHAPKLNCYINNAYKYLNVNDYFGI